MKHGDPRPFGQEGKAITRNLHFQTFNHKVCHYKHVHEVQAKLGTREDNFGKGLPKDNSCEVS